MSLQQDAVQALRLLREVERRVERREHVVLHGVEYAPLAEVDQLRSVLRRIYGMCKAGEWIEGDSLGRYLAYHLDEP